jgi:hypothetical protein
MNSLFAAAGLAEMSAAESRNFEIQIFRAWLFLAASYLIATTAIWLLINRRAIRGRRISPFSLGILAGVLAPGLIFLVLTPWPYWW